MPFIRQTRDKRGFEHTYVMHSGRPGAGPQRPRVLYLFRSPGNLRVGRQALDGEVREALEHTHPDLSFDWNALTREAVVTRSEPPPPRPMRGARPRPPVAAGPPRSVEPVAEDPSLLGRTLGASTAARVRGRFSEVTQRIGRRSRTPEEREVLLDKARALDPDSWADEATMRARAATFDRELDRIAAEVPSRRRGRRGGRHRHDPASRADPGAGQSAIMAGSDDQEQRGPAPADPGGDAGVGPADPETTGFPVDD